MFGKCLETGDVISEVIGTSVNIINKGFRDVNITYLGLLVVCNHEENKLYKINSSMDGLGILHPTEVHTNTFPKVDLINNFSILEKGAKVYAFAQDSEGNHYSKYIGKAKKIAQKLSFMR